MIAGKLDDFWLQMRVSNMGGNGGAKLGHGSGGIIPLRAE
jgi:hypothetical protein